MSFPWHSDKHVQLLSVNNEQPKQVNELKDNENKILIKGVDRGDQTNLKCPE